MAANRLANGTAFVAATGVIFDLWVSFWLVDRPNTAITDTVTIIIAVALLIGLFIMYQGWQEERAT